MAQLYRVQFLLYHASDVCSDRKQGRAEEADLSNE